MPSASAASSTPRATAAAPSPRFSSGNASSARTVPITTCVSGSWNSVPATAASVGRPVRARVEPAGLQPAGELAAVEVRHEPGGGAQQRRLARARPAGEHDELARLDHEVDVAQRRRGRAGVAVGDALEPQRRAHRPIPRRSANGSSAHERERRAERELPPPDAARANAG